MANKLPKTVEEQINLLLERGMLFKNIDNAPHFLKDISYYRLKGYWWEMQSNKVNHKFKEDSFFEDVLDLYNFDRHLRLLMFDATERIEVALRTKLIYHLSLSNNPLFYLDYDIFNIQVLTLNIEIYNLLGAKVYTVKNMSNPQSIYLEQLKNGVYIVVGKVSEKSFSRKILIGG